MSGDDALARAYELIDKVRLLGFKDGGARFSDAQIWRAIVDDESPGFLPDQVAVRLVTQLIDGTVPPEAEYLPNRRTP